MKSSLYAAIFVFLLLGISYSSSAQTGAQTTAKPVALNPLNPLNPLIQRLPDSDAVISVNTQKFLDVALPQLLGDSPKMAQISLLIAALKAQAGLDLHQFEQAAVGIKYKRISATEIDFEPVVLASGKFNAPGMLALVKIAANGKYREEQAGGKTLYILSVKDLMTDTLREKIRASGNEKNAEKLFRTFGNEIAVGALDEKTIAFGGVSRVQAAFAGNSPLSAELAAPANFKAGAMASFAGKVPAGLPQMFGMENDTIAGLIDSIQMVSGYLDMNGTNATLLVTAKTATAKQAMDIEDTMTGLRELGKVFVGGVKNPDERAVFTRLIENVKITRVGTQVKFNLLIPQSDLVVLGRKL